MNRSLALSLREKLQAHLESFAKEHNLSVNVGNGSILDSSLQFKVELAEIDQNGTVLNRDVLAFKRMARSYGLEPEDLGKTFVHDRRTFKIVGAAPQSRKYPIIAESTGQFYKMSVDTVIKGLYPSYNPASRKT